MSHKQREQLVDDLIGEIRAVGNARDALDQAVADRLQINLTDLRCMDILQQRGTATAGQLACAAGLSTGAVTTMLDRLERAGYVRRLRDPVDRRRVYVELTDASQCACGELFGPLGEDARRLFARYDEAQLALLRDFMRRDHALQDEHAQRIRALDRAARPAAPAR
ncbi:MAG: MarR family transcriptional regulator [Solirubrobacterales bacterium]|nr:MarR family transcriptional regulator [Solirubrobacterales bacterium]